MTNKEWMEKLRSERPACPASLEQRLAMQLRSLRTERPKARRRTALVIALALAALLACGALAEALNLFELFGRQDARLTEIAPQTALETESPVQVESEALGQTRALITGGYYDGSSLLVAYELRGASRMERISLAPDELAGWTKLEDTPAFAAASDEEQALAREWRQALESGTPMGLMCWDVYPSDHTETDDGVDLPPRTESEDGSESGVMRALREYEEPLPTEAQNRDALTIRIRLWQSKSGLYFDGRDCYLLPAQREEAGAMTATLPRSADERLRFACNVTYDGDSCRVTAEASRVSGSIRVESAQGVFGELPEDRWYELAVLDEAGHRLRTRECGARDAYTLEAAFDGTGTLPESLTAYILVASEGDWDEQAAMAAATPIRLQKEK